MSRCHSASAEAPPPPSPLSSARPLLVYSLPRHCPACIVISWIYTDANFTVGSVDVQLLVHGPQRLPRCHHPTTLSIKAPLPFGPFPHPSALLPIWGWPGCCSEGSSHPRSCQWPPSFPWAEHTIEKGLRLRGSVAINPYQLFLPRVFCATIRAPEGALTSTNLAIVGQECWQKKRNFSCVHASVCIHVWEPRNVGLISIVAREEGRPWRIPYLAAWQNSFAQKWKKKWQLFSSGFPLYCPGFWTVPLTAKQ